jgi:hypothetical protein
LQHQYNVRLSEIEREQNLIVRGIENREAEDQFGKGHSENDYEFQENFRNRCNFENS